MVNCQSAPVIQFWCTVLHLGHSLFEYVFVSNMFTCGHSDLLCYIYKIKQHKMIGLIVFNNNNIDIDLRLGFIMLFEIQCVSNRKPLQYTDAIYHVTSNGKEFRRLCKLVHDVSADVITKRKTALVSRKCLCVYMWWGWGWVTYTYKLNDNLTPTIVIHILYVYIILNGLKQLFPWFDFNRTGIITGIII